MRRGPSLVPSLGEITHIHLTGQLTPGHGSVSRKFLQSRMCPLCCGVLERLCKPIYIMIIIMARLARNKQMRLRSELWASPGNQNSADLRSVNIWRKPTNNDPVHSGHEMCWVIQTKLHSASSLKSFLENIRVCLKFKQHSLCSAPGQRNNYSAKKKSSTSAI